MWRLGNKSRLAEDIIRYFPEHDLYVEMFFGAGGLFFNKLKANYNILNDNDDFLINFYRVIIDNDKRNELIDRLELWLEHDELLKEEIEKHKNATWVDDIDKALCFIIINRFSLLGATNTMRYGMLNNKKQILEKIYKNYKMLINNVQVMKADFKDVLEKINFHKELFGKEWKDKDRTFIYADPPYLHTFNNYKDGFKEQDMNDLFKILEESGIRYAISHYKNDYFLDLCSKYNLNVVQIKERYGISKKKDIELLAMNYNSNQWDLFLK